MKKIAIIAILALTSCATVFDGSQQQVNITTDPNKPSKCTISGRDASLYTGTVDAPGKVYVRRSYDPITITCTPTDGSAPGTAKVLSDTSSYLYSALGFGVGTAIDASTGDGFEYPDNIVVKLGTTTTLNVHDLNGNRDSTK